MKRHDSILFGFIGIAAAIMLAIVVFSYFFPHLKQ